MFETGVDEMSWDDTENYRMGGSYKWPSLSDVVDYRRKVSSPSVSMELKNCNIFVDDSLRRSIS